MASCPGASSWCSPRTRAGSIPRAAEVGRSGSALAVAAILVGIAATARLLDHGLSRFPDLQLSAGQTPDTWEPLLVAAAGLCIAGLTVRRSPWLAWFSAGAAAALGAVDVMGQVRAQIAIVGEASTWLLLVGASASAAITAVGVTTILAATTAQTIRFAHIGLAARAIWAFAFMVVATIQAAVFVNLVDAVLRGRSWDPVTELRLPNRSVLALLAIDLAFAVVVIVVPRLRRAWVRSRPQSTTAAAEAMGVAGLFQALADEFVPGLAARTDQAAAAERERLAADLHARVVPELRRAAAAAPSEGAASSTGLRGALDGIETLMAERHSVVLEEFGLLAALEWLAERTEAHGRTTVELEVDGESDAGRPPRDVERAAFRVALLATDNATRHAPATPIRIFVRVTSRDVHIGIADTGPGIDPSAAEAARRDGHRGLADMEAAAGAVGASVAVKARDDGPGTRVTFTWAAR